MPKITPIPASKLRKVFERAEFKCVRIEKVLDDEVKIRVYCRGEIVN